MQINSNSISNASFKGFVRLINNNTELRKVVNTANILGIDSDVYGENEQDCGIQMNIISYIDSENKNQATSVVRNQSEGFVKDFKGKVAAACSKADRTGKIIDIYL